LVDRGVGAFSYTYDFGDNWQHTVTIETISGTDPALDYPRFIDGGRRAPPEDVGGIPGFEELLDAMAKPRHPKRKRLIRWYGGPFDPDNIDLPVITARLGRLTSRPPRAKAARTKKAAVQLIDGPDSEQGTAEPRRFARNLVAPSTRWNGLCHRSILRALGRG
jgi:hypothetical protein